VIFVLSHISISNLCHGFTNLDQLRHQSIAVQTQLGNGLFSSYEGQLTTAPKVF
jgi:hypothetical protein